MTQTPGDLEQHARQHILVLNTSPDFLDHAVDIFSEAVYRVSTSFLTRHSLVTITALQPTVVVLDLPVGDRYGWRLLEHLAHDPLTCQIPVVVLSTSPG